MSVSIVWISSEATRIYHFSDDRMEREMMRSGQELEIASRLEGSKQILILSPGISGKELFESLKSLHPHLAKRVVGCETLHSADDVQIAEYAIKYFRKPVTRPVS